MMILSVLFLLTAVPLLRSSGSTAIIEQGLKYAGSEFDATVIGTTATGDLKMSIIEPLREELWIGIPGIYLALHLRKGDEFAWGRSFFWGIMLIAIAVFQGIYEVAMLDWSNACMQTY
jgi:hypothetical protein